MNPTLGNMSNTEARIILERAKDLVEKQSNDEGLWFVAETAPEAYLQQELRALHAIIEDDETLINGLLDFEE